MAPRPARNTQMVEGLGDPAIFCVLGETTEIKNIDTTYLSCKAN
jgi:hypothetical protein